VVVLNPAGTKVAFPIIPSIEKESGEREME
jgi:hypothetical protein